MKSDTPIASGGRRVAIAALLCAVGWGPAIAWAADKGDLLEAWRKKDRAVRDYGRALRKIGNPTAEDRERLRREIIAPAEESFSKTRDDYHKESFEKVRQQAVKADRELDRIVTDKFEGTGKGRLPAEKAGEPGKKGEGSATPAKGDAAAAAAKDAAAKATAEKQKEAAAAKAPVERPGVPNMWERAPRRDVQLDGEGIPEVIIFGKGKAGEPQETDEEPED